jgi:hypothetical protein
VVIPGGGGTNNSTTGGIPITPTPVVVSNET